MLPNKKGYFKYFGGRFIPETLVESLKEIEHTYRKCRKDARFKRELKHYLTQYAGRPTPLYFARNLSRKFGKGRIYLKREDLCHTGAHKINNTIGQALVAKRMGKTRVIAETGAGQHGVAAATACSIFGLKCEIYMGQEDIRRQSINVFRMRLLGARVIEVKTGSCTLKDAINETLRDWVTNVVDTYYLLGSTVGPHPYPMMVRDFQSVIGKETKRQIMKIEGRLPDYLVCCVGGGSNAIGMFHPFFNDKVKFIGVEAGGLGLKSGKHAAPLCGGDIGILHGAKSYLMQDKNGQILATHSLAAGLDYPGVGPEHSYYKDIGRAKYVNVKDEEALRAFHVLSETEGIVPALESAHALGYLNRLVKRVNKNDIIVVCLSGRGEKDVREVARIEGVRL